VSEPTLVDELRVLGREAGLDAIGVAPAEPFLDTRRHLEERKAAGLHGGMAFTYRDPRRSTDPGAALPGARALVVGARAYRRRPVPKPEGVGPVARVAAYSWRDHYAPLRAALGVVAERLAGDGWRARVLVDDNALVDREAAYRAGLGWYGKSTNLLLQGRGSWFVLGSVVTDAPLPPDAPVADQCGSCTRCLPACPTGAIVAPGVLDARRCLAHLVQAPGPFPVELRPALGDRLYGCDDCQEACPPNRVDERRLPPPAAGDGDEAWVAVLDILAADDAELLRRFGRWYIPRRQPRYLRRNALVVLGNTADGADPAVEAALRRALADDDPLVRGHAVWAAYRLHRADLVDDLVGDDRHPDVVAEVGRRSAVTPRG
jgi:epoxyqueuosine reductase